MENNELIDDISVSFLERNILRITLDNDSNN